MKACRTTPICIYGSYACTPISSSVPYLAARSSPVHGTSSCTRTSGGRLNLGLAQPRVRYSASYRLQSGKLTRRSHSLTSLLLSFSLSFSLLLPLLLSRYLSFFLALFLFSAPLAARYVRVGKGGKGDRERGAMKSVPTRCPAGWQVYKEGKGKAKPGR